jgi:hypothetical protein
MTCVCRILRYLPNLLRDEHVNIGVLLHDPAGGRLELRLIESESELARLRRMHPAADLDLVRGLESGLRAQLAEYAGSVDAWLDKLEQTLSNTVQLSPQRGVFTKDFDAELDRIYSEQVAPMRGTRVEASGARAGLRRQANEILQRTDLLRKMKRSINVEEFTYAGDPMRLDYAYQQNGTQGFLHALSLDRDPAQAKALAFTSERIRARAASTDFTAVCESAPKQDNSRHRFVADLLHGQRIALVPLAQLEDWARNLSSRLQ